MAGFSLKGARGGLIYQEIGVARYVYPPERNNPPHPHQPPRGLVCLDGWFLLYLRVGVVIVGFK